MAHTRSNFRATVGQSLTADRAAEPRGLHAPPQTRMGVGSSTSRLPCNVIAAPAVPASVPAAPHAIVWSPSVYDGPEAEAGVWTHSFRCRSARFGTVSGEAHAGFAGGVLPETCEAVWPL